MAECLSCRGGQIERLPPCAAPAVSPYKDVEGKATGRLFNHLSPLRQKISPSHPKTIVSEDWTPNRSLLVQRSVRCVIDNGVDTTLYLWPLDCACVLGCPSRPITSVPPFGVVVRSLEDARHLAERLACWDIHYLDCRGNYAPMFVSRQRLTIQVAEFARKFSP